MNDKEPKELSLELSQETLAALFHDIGQSVVLSPAVESEALTGEVPVTDEGPTVFSLTIPIEGKVVKAIFYPGYDGLIGKNASEVRYTLPHRLEEEDNSVYETVSVECKSVLTSKNGPIQFNETYTINKVDGVYKATIYPEYRDYDGELISSNGLAKEPFDENDVDATLARLDDMTVLNRDFTLDDAEKVRILAETLR